MFDNVAELGLLHTYSVPTYAHGVCVVKDGKEKERESDRETETGRESE